MVQLSEGTSLSWPEIKAFAGHVRKHGVLQFINLYKKFSDRQDDPLLWGDEIEYMLICFDDTAKKATVSLGAAELLPELQKPERHDPESVACLWRPEYCNFMIEGTPGKPYGTSVADVRQVEANMKHRREEARAKLGENETLLTLTVFPRLGCSGFSTPLYEAKPESSRSRSLFLPVETVFPSPLFQFLAGNVRQKRGEKLAVNIPLFIDKATARPFLDNFESLGDDGERGKNALPDHIYMDAICFGLSCCCLQVTFQARDLSEARILHDQLAVFGPIMLALTAASPLQRGLIADTDCRWNTLSGAMDCRTRQERGLEPLTTAQRVIPKSRWSSLSTYISPDAENALQEVQQLRRIHVVKLTISSRILYNDIPLVYDEETYATLIAAGIDHHLARHMAYLFLRDCITLFKEELDHSAEEFTDLFDNQQITNWQNVRFKPPSPDGAIGWRVEFRTCEVQITDFENAATATFIMLLRRVVLSYKLNFLIPISKGDDNMERAHKRDAISNQKFWFCTNIITAQSPAEAVEICNKNCSDPSWSELTMDEIVNGKEGLFVGLVPLLNSYLKTVEVDEESCHLIQRYLEFIERRASGELTTDAKWIRNFVMNHPDYKYDSVVSEIVNYDLLKTIDKVVKGEMACPFLINTEIHNGI